MPIAPIATTEEQARQFRREKRKEAHTKRLQGTLGVAAAAAGATGAGLVATGKIRKLPNIVERGYTVGTGSAGLGALAGFNAARNQFKEAKVSSQQSRMHMDNTYKVKKSLVDIVKATEKKKPAKKRPSVAVPKDTEAWRMSGKRSDNRWRDYMQPSTQAVYDYPLAPSRQKSRQLDIGSKAAFGGAGLSAAATPFARGKLRIVPLAAAGGLTGTGAILRQKSQRRDEASRKIRARGYQRMLDAQAGRNAVVPVGKALIPRIPGSYNKPALLRLGNRTILRRPVPTGR